MRKWTKVRFCILLVVQEHKRFRKSFLANWPISASLYLVQVCVHLRKKTDLPLQSGNMSDAAALMANAPKYNKYYVEEAQFWKRMQFFILIVFPLSLICTTFSSDLLFLWMMPHFPCNGMSTLLFKWATAMWSIGIFRAPCVGASAS